MAYFAELDKNNIVKRVIAVNNDAIDSNDEEKSGIAFCKSLYGQDTIWKQTSYNATIRKNYASVGYIYDAEYDAFIPPQPFPSWKLNYQESDWEAPVPYPVDDEGFLWFWSEFNKEWVKSTRPSAKNN